MVRHVRTPLYRPRDIISSFEIVVCHRIRAGLNDGLFQKRWTFVTLPSVLWHIVYLSNMDLCPKILVHTK